MRANKGAWIGWPGDTEQDVEPFDADGLTLVPIAMSQSEYTEFYEYSELTLSKADNLTITGTAPVPAADVVDPADIATGGSKSENYEGCLVEVQNVTVTKPVAMYGEFSVTGDLVVDDLFFAPDPGPNPAMGKMYSSITGQLAFSFDVFKLSPRSLADLVD